MMKKISGWSVKEIINGFYPCPSNTERNMLKKTPKHSNWESTLEKEMEKSRL